MFGGVRLAGTQNELHYAGDRVRAHVCLCMLVYYPEWHMRQHLAPMAFDGTDKIAAEALRTSVVAQAQR